MRGEFIRKLIFALLALISCIAVTFGLSACDGCGKKEEERHTHNYIATVTESTCTAKGYTTYNCECGRKYVADYTDPLGHNFDGKVCLRCGYELHDHIYTRTTVQADCTNGGYTRGVCDICGATFTTDIVGPLGHDCDNGFCKRCDYFNAEEHKHVYEVQSTAQPDCINKGYTDYGCRCGESYRNDTDPLGHDYTNGRCNRCNAAYSTVGLKYTLSSEGTYYICTGLGTAEDSEIVIASEVNGKPVMAIKEWAFSDCKQIRSVHIPESVVSLGRYAFNNCTNLVSAELPDSITAIEEYTFYNCTSLTEIAIPNSVIVIGNNAFFQCLKLTEVTMPKNLDAIGRYVFGWCTELSGITIPDGVTFIDSYAFFKCRSLTEIVIPESVREINFGAFDGCTSLTIYCEAEYKPAGWDRSWNSSGCTVIWDCRNYEQGEEELEYTLSYNGEYYICTGIGTVTDTDIVIAPEYNGKPVKEIGDEAFLSCRTLKTIVIYNSVTYIGERAFDGCSALTDIILPDSITYIGYRAFCGCSSLKSITLPNSVEYLGSLAFVDCSSLKSIYIPDSVTYIGIWRFSGCDSLESVTVAEGNPVYHSAGNCIIDTKFKRLVAGCNISVIPDDGSVINISSVAFEGCTQLTSITIPNSVKYIGTSAFAYCTGLKSVTIPNSVSDIGAIAFAGCTQLTSITLPDSVTRVGEGVFYGCDNLTIYCESKEQPDGWDSTWNGDCPVIWDCKKEELEYTLSYNGEYYICTGIGTVTEADAVIQSEYRGKPVKAIGDKAFEDCYELKSIIIPDSVTAIGNSAFEDCYSLTEAHVPDTVISIGRYAFAYCVKLTSVNIPDGLVVISEGTYRQCTSVTSITIPDSVIQINKMAFYCCQGLTSVTIPDSVTTLGEMAFGYCRNLQSMTIGIGVKKIGDRLFDEYDSVTDIYYNGTKAEWNAIAKSESWDGPLTRYTIHCKDGNIIIVK